MYSFSHPTAADIPAIVELWNAAFGPEWPLTERLLRQTMKNDPFYESEGCWLAHHENRLVGWVLSKSMRDAGPEMGRFQRRGGIGALCVHPDVQRQGLGSQLLDKAETYLQEAGSPVTLLYYPHHLLPGIPAENAAAIALFRQRGYSGFRECVDLWRDLNDFVMPEKARQAIAKNPTVELRPTRDNEVDALKSFVAREFPGGWTYSTGNHFKQGGKAADLIVAVEAGEIIGFCHTADFRSPWLLPSTYWFPLLGDQFGGLGPIGIGAQHRKRGLGLALCGAAVQNLKERGVTKMGIDWTTLVDFYGLLGFQVWKRYLQAERQF